MVRCIRAVGVSLVLALGCASPAIASDDGGLLGSLTQSNNQSQTGSNSITQDAGSKALALNVAPNVAILNSGDVEQSSEANASSEASNENESDQSVDQGQTSGQAQTGGSGSGSQEQASAQDNAAANSIDQSAESKAVALNLSPNIAIANGGSGGNSCKDACGKHENESPAVEQKSSADASSEATNQNKADQSIDQSQQSGQSQAAAAGKGDGCNKCDGGGESADQSQTSNQSNTASNSIAQNAESKAIAVNLAPNIAIANHGDVEQQSSADADSKASNRSEADQSIDQSQKSGQSQAAGSGKGYDCKCDREGGADQSQSNSQSNSASNSIDQSAESKAIAVNAAPNVAILNHGDVKQESDADATSKASNKNEADQSISQDQANHQSQTGAAGKGHKGDDCGCKDGDENHGAGQKQENNQSNSAANTINQYADSEAFALNKAPNVAIGNGGGKGGPSNGCGCDKGYGHDKGGKGGSVEQESGADADSEATNRNEADQWIGQNQANHQTQTGAAGKGHKGGDCGCKDGDENHGAGQTQSNNQSNNASNSINQSAESEAVAINKGKNLAYKNGGEGRPSNGCGCDKGYGHDKGGKGGSVDQKSGAHADSKAANSNHSNQGVSQDQANHQSQTGAAGKGHKGDDCGCKDGDENHGAGQKQENNQSNSAANTINQYADSEAFALNKAPNVAIGNGGGKGGPSNGCGCDKGYGHDKGGKGGSVEQESGADADSEATNRNEADQWIGQNQANHQTQTGAAGKGHKGGDCGCKDGDENHGAGQTQSNNQSNNASNSINQSAESEAVAINKGKNLAYKNGGEGRPSNGCGCDKGYGHDKGGKGGSVDQKSGANADSKAANSNHSNQGVSQDQANHQSQTGAAGHGCGCTPPKPRPCGCHEPKAKPKPCGCEHPDPRKPAKDTYPGKPQGDNGCGCGDHPASQSQTNNQNQTATNQINQSATSNAFALNKAPNKAFFNNGDVRQRSSADADSAAINTNKSWQGIDQDQLNKQAQTA